MTSPRNGRPVNILLVEDNPLDARTVIKAAERLQVPHTIEVITDGDTAIDRLQGSDGRPDLVLLDLDLPGRHGHEVLTAIKSDPVLRRVPVVVLTTSSDASDVAATYDLGANAFVTKPTGLDKWFEVVATIEGFWLDLVELPPE